MILSLYKRCSSGSLNAKPGSAPHWTTTNAVNDFITRPDCGRKQSSHHRPGARVLINSERRFKPLGAGSFKTAALSRTSPRHVVRNAGWLLQRRGRLRATGRAGSIHCTDRRPRPTGQTRSVRQSPRRLHAITGAASIRAPGGSRLDQTILFAASMMWRAEIPNRSSKDAEGPLRGMERTASL